MDMSRIRVSAGDYRESDIADELERTFAPEVIASEYARLAAGRKGIAFWPLVATSYHAAGETETPPPAEVVLTSQQDEVD